MSTANPRYKNGHRRRQVRARVLREETVCWICGGEVDKTLPTPHPESAEVDEVVPVSAGGSPTDRRNCRLSHRRCNVGRNRTRQSRIVPLTTTRDWTPRG